MRRYITVIMLIVAFEFGFGQTHVQTATLYQISTSKNISVSFASPSTKHNLIIVHVDWDNQSAKISSITDTKSNTYTRISGPTNWNGTNYRAELWYAYDIDPGTITVTAKLNNAPTSFFQMYISEYSGIAYTIDPLDKNAAAIGNTAAVNSGSQTTAYTKELIYGASIGASGALSKGAGFTARSTANQNIIEDKVVSTTGSYSAGFTSAGGNWVAQMATFISSNVILPIELISFTGYCDNTNINLEWETATETNNDYFTIEESDDASNWKAVGTVKSKGDGSNQKYSFVASATDGKTSYFRLKQTDLNGQFKYFKTIEVNNCAKNVSGASIYPNPSNGQSLFGKINLKADEKYAVEIFDSMGKPVEQFTSTQPQFAINFSHKLTAGIYYAKFVSASYSAVTPFLVR